MMQLVRLYLRSRRGFLLAWLLPLIGLMAITVPAYRATYPDSTELEMLAGPMRANLGLRMMYGIVPEPFTFGAFAQWETGMWLALLGSVMTVLLAVRLTRAGEDDGTLELIRSSGLPTRVPTAAAATVVGIASFLLGAGTTLALLLSRLYVEDLAVTGAILTGAAITLTTAASGAVGLWVAQIAGTPRGARGLGMAYVAVAFAVRAYADVREIDWLRWLSPLGWRDIVNPYSGDRVWPLVVMLVVTVALMAGAVAVSGARDLGAVWPAREGRRRTADRDHRGLNPMGLRLRLERGTLIGWTIAMALLSVFMMAMTGEMGELLDASPGTRELIEMISSGTSMEAIFVEMLSVMLGIILCAAAIQVALSAHTDEKEGLLSLEWASGGRRARPFLLAWLVAVGLVVVMCVISSPLGAWAAEQSSGAEGIGGDAAWAIAGKAPAAIGMVGIAVALSAALPKLTWLAWIPLAASGFLSYLGGLFEFIPQWVLDASMLAQSPRQPDGTETWTGTIVLLAIGVGGAIIAAALAQKRDTLV